MRKMLSSGKTSCRVAFSVARRREVAAERLLDDDPRVLRRSRRRASCSTTVGNMLGGIAR